MAGEAPGANMDPPVAAVLFDMDGLLLDTEGAYTIAQQRILDRFGRTFTWELKAKMMGRQVMEGAQLLLDELGLGPEQITAQQFLSERDALLESVFPESPLMPGAERLVRHLVACGVPAAVATGSHRAAFELKTSRHREFFSLFSHVVTGDMVARSKPHPEIFLHAAEGFRNGNGGSGAAANGAAKAPDGDGEAQQGEDSGKGGGQDQGNKGGTDGAGPFRELSEVLVFEDAPNGVAAALAGGMRVVMVPYPGMPEELARCGATQVLRSLEEFRPEQWGLPPFPSQ